jgi:site-specific DNA recombinase
MLSYVIYSRKSQEDDDKQVQSIPDQEAEMNSVATRTNLTVIELLSESKSAKAPGRPVFDAMMQRVDRGEIRGILCWKLDRLARNPVDGGRIIWAIKQHGLVVRTPHQTFSQADDNLILMYIEFGMAQKYVDDLSRNTTRGLTSKAQKGWYPSVAPTGYLNSKTEERGHRTILRDPARFDAVRRMWDLMLSGQSSPTQIQRIANDEWGFRTRQTRRTGGKPLARSTIYKIFSNPFYCGRFEYPQGSGTWYRGNHEPMVTEAEFNAVQLKLKQETNPRPHKEFALPYRGLLKCGACGSSITAHFKEQVRCTRCHYKSSVKNSRTCAKCHLPMSEMKSPTLRRYAYYHCTRTLNPSCRQKCLSATALDRQIAEKLPAYALPAQLQDWGLAVIEKLREQELAGEQRILNERQQALRQCVLRLENLLKLKTAPENSDGSLLSDEEYQQQRADLLALKARLSANASAFQNELEAKARLSKVALKVVTTIDHASRLGDATKKKEILSALGLNHAITDGKLVIKPEFPFSELPRADNPEPRDCGPIEPINPKDSQGREGRLVPSRPRQEPGVEEDRTTKLKEALETIWKKTDPRSPAFQRYPFVKGCTGTPGYPRGGFRRIRLPRNRGA